MTISWLPIHRSANKIYILIQEYNKAKRSLISEAIILNLFSSTDKEEQQEINRAGINLNIIPVFRHTQILKHCNGQGELI